MAQAVMEVWATAIHTNGFVSANTAKQVNRDREVLMCLSFDTNVDIFVHFASAPFTNGSTIAFSHLAHATLRGAEQHRFDAFCFVMCTISVLKIWNDKIEFSLSLSLSLSLAQCDANVFALFRDVCLYFYFIRINVLLFH